MIKYTTRRANNVITQSMSSKDKKKERIPQSVIDTLLDSVSIDDLVKESTQTKTINGELRSPCPFHIQGKSENTLLIDTQEQRVVCDECNFHASCLGWLMYHDGLSFEDSALFLAARTNTDISKWISESDIERARQNKNKIQTDALLSKVRSNRFSRLRQ